MDNDLDQPTGEAVVRFEPGTSDDFQQLVRETLEESNHITTDTIPPIGGDPAIVIEEV